MSQSNDDVTRERDIIAARTGQRASTVGQGSWSVKREVSVNVVLALIGGLSGVAGVLWEGGQITATMQAGITAEHELRVTEGRAMGERVDALSANIRELSSEFHSYLIAQRTSGRAYP